MNKYLLLLLSLPLAACSNQEDLQVWMEQKKQEAASYVKQPVTPSLPAPVSYEAPVSNSLNMFNPSRLYAGAGSYNAPTPHPKEVLENFTLDTLQYVGIIQPKSGKTSAYVNANDHIYTVHIGNYMGQDLGRITAITPDAIELVEMVRDASGNWNTRPASLPLSAASNHNDSPN